MKKVTIYTDGACSGNPGKGGWAAILIYNGHEKEISGFEAETTNNQMELCAVIEGIKALKEPCEVDIYSDSAYVVNAFNNGWIEAWKNNGWKNSKKKPVENKNLWETLLFVMRIHKVNFIKVDGHTDNEYNNRCDKLAVARYKRFEI